MKRLLKPFRPAELSELLSEILELPRHEQAFLAVRDPRG
jgi:hypothetical protein